MEYLLDNLLLCVYEVSMKKIGLRLSDEPDKKGAYRAVSQLFFDFAFLVLIRLL